jgi:hypothetical protein
MCYLLQNLATPLRKDSFQLWQRSWAVIRIRAVNFNRPIDPNHDISLGQPGSLAFPLSYGAAHASGNDNGAERPPDSTEAHSRERSRGGLVSGIIFYWESSFLNCVCVYVCVCVCVSYGCSCLT